MSGSGRPLLALAEIEAFDPQGRQGRRLCPLCGADKPKDAAHRSLSLDASTGKWKCFRCGAGGVVREKWASSGGERPRGVLQRQKLAVSFGLAPPAGPRVAPVAATPTAAPAPEIPQWRRAWEECAPVAGTPGEAYLARRGLPGEVAVAAGIRYGARWPGGAAVVFPLLDRDGALVAVQGRAVRGDAKRTYGPKKDGIFRAPVRLPSGRLLDPLERGHGWVIVAEAPLDALSLASAGYPALALCGTSGPSWLHLACGLKRVLLALDADEAGDSASLALEAHLAPYGSRCERLRPEGAKDWNELLVGQGRERLSDWLAGRVL